MTPNKNNASIIRKDLLIRICKQLLNNKPSEINRIPIKLKPRGRDPWRCCVYKDRAILKYKIMSMLGYSEQDETDELTPLHWYAQNPKGTSGFYINLITEACSNCPSPSYVVTNLCRGCEARPCQVNCPKDAVSFKNGQAVIDSDKCINCGKCMRECPYNAIHFQPRPCQEACPVDAISQNPKGYEEIDMDKCILCGRCMQACPFGAIVPSTDLPQIIKEIKSKKEVIAMVAPAIAGQFRASLQNIYEGILKAGFTDIYEVARGAEQTAKYEADELNHLMQDNNHPALMSSCCPSWVDYAHKNKPEWKANISKTPSPMALTAEDARQKHPGATLVFIGPCLAKKAEAKNNPNTNYAISFEELGTLLVASDVEFMEEPGFELQNPASALARNFASSGGVEQAIKSLAHNELNTYVVNGCN